MDLRIDPAVTGLVVVDMQNGFCHPQGSRGKAFGPESVAMAPGHRAKRGPPGPPLPR